jgi:hypothetical protein
MKVLLGRLVMFKPSGRAQAHATWEIKVPLVFGFVFLETKVI